MCECHQVKVWIMEAVECQETIFIMIIFFMLTICRSLIFSSCVHTVCAYALICMENLHTTSCECLTGDVG